MHLALYFSARKGRRFRFLPEIGLPEGFSVPGLQRWIRQVDYEPLRIAVQERWERLAEANRFGSSAMRCSSLASNREKFSSPNRRARRIGGTGVT